MPGGHWNKPVIYKQLTYLLLLVAVASNEFVLPLLQGWHIFPAFPATSTHAKDVAVYLPRVISGGLLSIGLIMLTGKRSLTWYLGHSVWFNLWVLFLCITLLFVTNPIGAGSYIGLRVLMLLILFFFLINCLYLTSVQKKEWHPVYRNALLSVYSFVFIFFLIEGIFMFVQRPHHQNDTLASRNWFTHHWRVNELGYRDAPIDTVSGKKSVLIIGDSFGAGHGIPDVKHRFGEQLGSRLGSDFVVHNACYPGLDTRNEFRNLVEYPVKPDFVVLQWYPNDIEKAGLEAGHSFAYVHPYNRLGVPMRFLVEHSYLINYFFWLTPKEQQANSFVKFSEDSFHDPAALAIHEHDLQHFVSWSEVNHVPLVVVAFPFMQQVKKSAYTTEPIVRFFESRNVEVIDVGHLVAGKAENELVVNNSDAHASKDVHLMVGRALYEIFVEKGWK